CAASWGVAVPLKQGTCVNTLAFRHGAGGFRTWPDHGPRGFAWPGRRAVFGITGRSSVLEAFLVSTGIVALAEMGDKTQLLSLLLAARFRRPVPIILGILAATLFNHALAGAVGAWLTQYVGGDVMRWVLGASFIAMAVWMLIPDKLDKDESDTCRFGVFGTTLMAFFLAEMGD